MINIHTNRKMAYERYNISIGQRTLQDYCRHFILFLGDPSGEVYESCYKRKDFKCSEAIKNMFRKMFDYSSGPIRIGITNSMLNKLYYTGWNFQTRESLDDFDNYTIAYYPGEDESLHYPIYIKLIRIGKNSEISYIEPKELENQNRIVICINVDYIDTLSNRESFDAENIWDFIESVITHELIHAFDMYVLGEDDILKHTENSAEEDLFYDKLGIKKKLPYEYNYAQLMLHLISPGEQKAYIEQVCRFIINTSRTENKTHHRIVERVKNMIEEEYVFSRESPFHSKPRYTFKIDCQNATDYLCKCVLDDETVLKMCRIDSLHNEIGKLFENFSEKRIMITLAIIGYYLYHHNNLKYVPFKTVYNGKVVKASISEGILQRFFDEHSFYRFVTGTHTAKQILDSDWRAILEFILFNIESNLLKYEDRMCNELVEYLPDLFSAYGLTTTIDDGIVNIKYTEEERKMFESIG